MERKKQKNYFDSKSNESYPFKGPIFKKFQGQKKMFFLQINASIYITLGLVFIGGKNVGFLLDSSST